MRRRHEALRRVFGVMVEDVLLVAGTRLGPADLHSAQDIRDLGLTIIRFSDRLFRELKVIRQFLFTRMYRAPSVVEMRAKVTNDGGRPVPAIHGAAGDVAGRVAQGCRARSAEDETGAGTGSWRNYVSGMTRIPFRDQNKRGMCGGGSRPTG